MLQSLCIFRDDIFLFFNMQRAIFQLDSPAAKLIDQCDVMAGDQQGDANLIEAPENSHHLEGQVRVEIAGGLIRNKQFRSADNGSRDADALLLAGGKRFLALLLLVEQPNLVQCCPNPACSIPMPGTCNDERQGDVVEHRSIVKELVVLEDHADLSSIGRDVAS